MPPNSEGTGSESVLESESDPDPILARKKAPSARSGRQLPPKTKPAPTQSLVEKGGPSKKAQK